MPRVKQVAPPIDPNDLFRGLRPEQDLWLRRFLDVTDKACFMRPEQTAKAIGKSANFGLFQKNILGPRIKAFLSDCGLDEQSLRCKLVELLHVRTTKTMVIPGQVEEWELPDCVKILGVFQRDKVVGAGEFMTTIREDVTLVCIDEEAPDLQRRALDMAFKLTEMYPAERVEHSGPKGGPIELSDIDREARLRFIAESVRRADAERRGVGGAESPVGASSRPAD